MIHTELSPSKEELTFALVMGKEKEVRTLRHLFNETEQYLRDEDVMQRFEDDLIKPGMYRLVVIIGWQAYREAQDEQEGIVTTSMERAWSTDPEILAEWIAYHPGLSLIIAQAVTMAENADPMKYRERYMESMEPPLDANQPLAAVFADDPGWADDDPGWESEQLMFDTY